MSTWTNMPLGSVATLQRGFDLPKRLRRPGNVPVVSSSGVSGWHDQSQVSGPGVITGRYGTIGEVFFQEGDFWPLNTTLWVSNFHGNDERFVYYLLQRVDFHTHSGKSGVPGVNRNDLHAEVVGLPASTDEQETIATALDDADRLVASLERTILKKQAIQQGMIQELLTGKTRLPGFVDSWDERTLGDIAKIKTGSRNNQDKRSGGRFPFFVRSATVERIDSYSYDCEAILVPGEGGIGSIFHYINGKFEVHQRVYKISDFSTEVNGRFLYHYMRYRFGGHAMENSVKATVDSLRLPTFKKFVVMLPSTVEQDAIAAALDCVEDEIDALSGRLAKTRMMKQGMMQQLLTGLTRLCVEKGAP